MMKQFDTMTVSDTRQPLAEPATVLLSETHTPLARSVSPTLLFWVVFLAVMCFTLLEWQKGWSLRWFDRTLFSIAAIFSLMALFLWFFTDHYCTKVNLNVLWASPLFVYFAIRLQRSNRVVVYIQLAMLFAAMVMTLGPLPQHLNAALFPISLTLALRLISNTRRRIEN